MNDFVQMLSEQPAWAWGVIVVGGGALVRALVNRHK